MYICRNEYSWKKTSDDQCSIYSMCWRFAYGCPQDSIEFVRKSVTEVITSMDSNLTCSLLKLLDCFLQPFITHEVRVCRSLFLVPASWF